MNTVQDTLAAKQEALTYGATPVNFAYTDAVMDALATDWSSGSGPSTHNYPDPLFALTFHAAVLQGRLNMARYQKDRERRALEKMALLPPGDSQIPPLQAQAAVAQCAAMAAYGQFLDGIATAEQFDFFPAVIG